MTKRVIVVMMAVGLCAAATHAGLNATGDVDPADPATWTSATTAYIGETGEGSVTVDDDSDLLSRYGYLGYQPGSTGTVTVSEAGSTWASFGDLYLGHMGAGELSITDGGLVMNRDVHMAYVAGSAGAVTVDGTGSRWTSPYLLYFGYAGDATVDVTAGGAGEFWDCQLGYQPGSTGVLTVDGAGSTWTSSSSLYIGRSGDGTLNVTDGGAVTAGSVAIAYDAGPTGSGAATVSGTGSTWTTDALSVGYQGNGTLDISAGGTVSSSSGTVGSGSDSTGIATVDGAGTTWTSSGNMRVGYDGSGTLNVTGGGAVSSVTGSIGTGAGATGVATVTGAGSTWNVASDLHVGVSGDGTLSIADGGLVTVDEDTYVASEAGGTGAISFTNGATLTTGGLLSVFDDLSGTGTINTNGLVSDVDLVFDATHGLTKTFILTDPGQNITINLDVDGSGSMGAGYRGNGSMHIADGMSVQSTSGFLAYHAGSAGAATVDGPGSTWTVDGFLDVGRSGDGTLGVTDGGTVDSGAAYVARQTGSTGAVTVAGAGSTVYGDVDVGYYGDGTLDVTDGGTLSGGGIIGYGAGSTGVATVSGTGSAWTYSGNRRIGWYGNGTLEITDGGAVSGHQGYIGYEQDSTGAVTVTGAGSTWTNTGGLRVGDDGSGTLTVAAGGAVTSAGSIGSYIARGADSTGVATVSGAGSTWTEAYDVHVGYYGSGTLNVADGGLAEINRDTYVARTPGSTGAISFDNGTLTTGGLLAACDDLSGTGTINLSGLVSDVALVFDATHGLTQTLMFNDPGQNITVNVDVDGSGSTGAGYGGNGSIHIADGLVVQSAKGYLGFQSGSTGVATVDGVGSAWTNSGYLRVGLYGNGTLNITNGGVVSSVGDATIGDSAGATGVVTVDGAGSAWTNSARLYVGDDSDGTLTIAAGAAVSNTSGYLARGSGSTSTVTVTGAGSTWTNSSNVYVGYDGDGTLNITDGGVVSNRLGMISASSGGIGAVTVSGVGSTWTNSTTLYVSLAGDGRLDLSDGGMASAMYAHLYASGIFGIGLSGVPVESRLDVAVEASLAGELNVSLLNGFLPTPASEFLVVDAATLDGTFDTFSFPNAQEWYIDYDMPAGEVSVGFLDWSVGNFDQDQDIDATDIDLLADAIRLGSTDLALFDISADGTTGGADGVIGILDLDYLVRFLVDTTMGNGTEYGDFNLDGLVDTTDLTRLATNFGPGSSWDQGNANRNLDLVIDTTDLTILATCYGFDASADAIPEPATLSLLALGGLAMLRRRKK